MDQWCLLRAKKRKKMNFGEMVKLFFVSQYSTMNRLPNVFTANRWYGNAQFVLGWNTVVSDYEDGGWKLGPKYPLGSGYSGGAIVDQTSWWFWFLTEDLTRQTNTTCSIVHTIEKHGEEDILISRQKGNILQLYERTWEY